MSHNKKMPTENGGRFIIYASSLPTQNQVELKIKRSPVGTRIYELGPRGGG